MPRIRCWFNLALFCAVRILQEMVWISYSPVTAVVEEHFGASEFLVSTLASGWMVTYMAFSVPAAVFLKKFGLRASVISAMLMLSAGSAIRLGGCLGNEFWVLWTGQQISALCMILTFQASPTMSRVWFGENERALATGVGFLSGAFGNMLAFFVVPAVVTDGRSLDILHIAECAASVAVFLLVLLGFKDHPDIPPTQSSREIIEMTDKTKPEESVIADRLEPDSDEESHIRKRKCECGNGTTFREFISIVTDPACILLWIVLTLEYGVYNTMCILMEQRLPRFTQMQNGIVAGMMVVGGVTFTVTASLIVGKFRCYKTALIIASAASIPGSIGFVAIELADYGGSGGLAIAVISAFVLGGCALGATAIGMETGAEYTFPTHEIVTSSVFSVTGCPVIVGMIVGAEFLSARATFFMVAGACCAATAISFFLPRKYLRTAADSKNEEEKSVGTE